MNKFFNYFQIAGLAYQDYCVRTGRYFGWRGRSQPEQLNGLKGDGLLRLRSKDRSSHMFNQNFGPYSDKNQAAEYLNPAFEKVAEPVTYIDSEEGKEEGYYPDNGRRGYDSYVDK